MDDDVRPVVWAVCEAEWEQNGPVAIFTTQALADEHCAALEASGSGNHEVRKFPLLNAAPQKIMWHWRQICVRGTDGVTVRHKNAFPGWDYEYADPMVDVIVQPNAVVINAHATTEEAAEAACEAELTRRALP